MTTDKSGQFQFRGLPPGEYRVLAWEDVDPGAWFNPAFLAVYERYATAHHACLKEKIRKWTSLQFRSAGNCCVNCRRGL